MNKAILIGRLTKPPENRTTTNGTSVCTFTIAVDRFKGQNAEKQTDFIPIVTWRTLAETCGRFLTKGSQVAVWGTIQTRSYDGNDGKRYVTEVVATDVEFLGSKRDTLGDVRDEPDTIGDIPGFTEIEDGDLPF